MIICKHVYYSGRVQGVGFRYTVSGLAERFPVTGYVRNLPDGDVEVVAEGDEDSVAEFLTAIGQQMVEYVGQTRVHDEAARGLKDFRIRY